MRAWCQHCDATELIAPEEIYSPEFNFWCPRCQSILILQDDGGAAPAPEASRPSSYADSITKVDREDVAAERQAPTKEDDDEPLDERRAEDAPIDVAVAEPEAFVDEEPVAPQPERRRTASHDAYSALAAELDAGIAADELSRPTRRQLDPDQARERITQREAKRSGAFRLASRSGAAPAPKTSGALPRTRADSEGPDSGRTAPSSTNGHANGDGPREPSVRELADIARGISTSRHPARRAAP